MVQINTKLSVFDNSGARLVKCIKNFNSKTYPGNFLLASVKSLRLKQKIKLKITKGTVVFAFLLKTTVASYRFSGLKIRSFVNGVVITNKQKQPVGTRVFGVVPRDLKQNLLKLLTLSGNVV
jgi:large subunit ribosomal protein L14